MNELLQQDLSLRAEADKLLARGGLRSILAEYGEVHVGGSYALGLMTWRDLDLHLRAPGLPVERFLDLGRRIGSVLSPWKMRFTNHREFPTTEVVSGLYWGIHLGDVGAGAWKIDLWAFEADVWQQQVDRTRALGLSIQPEERIAILRLKSDLWRHPAYRKTISSQDVYDSVLAGGARDLAGFWRFVGSRTGRVDR